MPTLPPRIFPGDVPHYFNRSRGEEAVLALLLGGNTVAVLTYEDREGTVGDACFSGDLIHRIPHFFVTHGTGLSGARSVLRVLILRTRPLPELFSVAPHQFHSERLSHRRFREKRECRERLPADALCFEDPDHFFREGLHLSPTSRFEKQHRHVQR